MRKLLSILTLALVTSLASHAQFTQEAISMENAIEELSKLSNSANGYNRTASFVSYHGPKDSTRGSRLLFNNWPRGYVLGAYDTLLKNYNLFLNFDKITRALYFTLDGKTIVKVQTDQARELHFTDSNTQLVLVRVDGIDPRLFFQRLSDSSGNDHYILYRLTKTQYRRANYQTDGLVSTGNNYDEYVDSYDYYLVMPGGKLYTPVKLKKKDIRAALGSKADAWLDAHRNSPPDESFLIGLVNHLNN